MRTMERRKVVLWISMVYIISFACYVPMMLRQQGVSVPQPLLYLKYGFVLTPALVTILFLSYERRLRACFTGSLHRISRREAGICAAAALTGSFITFAASFIEKRDLFGEAYRSIALLVSGCVYLFATAAAEEMAWRGFLLQQTRSKGKQVVDGIFTGIIWGFWHIPMWVIRNGLRISGILPLFIWTVLASVVLGAVYAAFRNLLSVSLLHMILNVCFLAPVQYNVLIVCLGIVVCRSFRKFKPA